MADDVARSAPRSNAGVDELDFRRFQLAILSQATQDMVSQRDPDALLESFLLTTMGAVGAVMGFNVVLPPFSGGQHADTDAQAKGTLSCASGQAHLVSRGLNDAVQQGLLAELNELAASLPPPAADAARGTAQIVIRDAPAATASFPRETALVLGWKATSGRCGFLGLGPRLSDTPYDAETTDFLQHLLHLFIQTLETACAASTIGSLNRELQRNNDALHLALHQARESQAGLDRRVYQLRTLYDAATELSPLRDVDEIMDRFLLVILGALGVDRCCLLLHDTKNDSFSLARRGIGGDAAALSDAEAKMLLFAAMGASSFQELTPLSAQLLPPESLQNAPSPLPQPGRAMLLRVDENCLGLLLIGGRITGTSLSDEDDEVLRSLGHNVMLFLRNARSFATIQALNSDLQTRNLELERTLEELTASRSHIEVLERAGARLRGMLQQHAERIGRISIWDFVAIFVASIALGVFFNMNNPNGVALLPEEVTAQPSESMSVTQAREALATEPEAVLVDARPAAFYEQRHAKGSVNMPPSLFDFIYSMRFSSSEQDPLFIIYGRTISRLYDEEIARRLKSQGHQRVIILQGGIEAWQKAGGEMSEGA